MALRAIPLDILDDLSSRFITNIPVENRKNWMHLFFQIELAYWFYLDVYYKDRRRKLNKCNMDELSVHLCRHIPFLRAHLPRVDIILKLLRQWREYKHRIPTVGAIMLNEDMSKVLLVESFWRKNLWGFPKGKVNEDEHPALCASREVLEETGFDISLFINKNHFIEHEIKNQLVRLYIIPGVKESTKFQTLTTNEIGNIKWFSLSNLPYTTMDMTPQVKMGIEPKNFFLVAPFIREIKLWVKQQREEELSMIYRH
ncbi:GSCOCG00010540001-RA-CDS, partial [Cotesia congregata]